MSDKPTSSTPKKTYAMNKSKTLDFFVGFFGIILFGWIYNLLIQELPRLLPSYLFSGNIGNFVYIILFAIPIIASILVILKLNQMNRRYVSIGIISAIAVPLVAMGACYIVVMGFMTTNGGF
ncbi:hypothetical protein KKF55_03535 [Patescibacteria group bacterium]|nr:hypothetical protein [Patescibacteria group bacterium]